MDHGNSRFAGLIGCLLVCTALPTGLPRMAAASDGLEAESHRRIAVLIRGGRRPRAVQRRVVASLREHGLSIVASREYVRAARRSGVGSRDLFSLEGIQTTAEEVDFDAVLHGQVVFRKRKGRVVRFTLYSAAGERLLTQGIRFRKSGFDREALQLLLDAIVEDVPLRQPPAEPPALPELPEPEFPVAEISEPDGSSTHVETLEEPVGEAQGEGEASLIATPEPWESSAPNAIGAAGVQTAPEPRAQASAVAPAALPPAHLSASQLGPSQSTEPTRLPLLAVDLAGAAGWRRYRAVQGAVLRRYDPRRRVFPVAALTLYWNPLRGQHASIRGLGLKGGISHAAIARTTPDDPAKGRVFTPVQGWWVDAVYQLRLGGGRWAPTAGVTAGYSDTRLRTRELGDARFAHPVLPVRRLGARFGALLRQPVLPSHLHLEVAAAMSPRLRIGPRERALFGDWVESVPVTVSATLRGSSGEGGCGFRWAVGAKYDQLDALFHNGRGKTSVTEKNLALSASLGYGF